ncbi:MAG: tetratricopeptide repeat protein [Verrucomicrobiia bacterium]|jgi:tetratricopeptide (TPR) repeat protein
MNSDQIQRADNRLDEPKPRLGRLDWLLALFLAASTFLAYQPVWHGRPLWDDWRHMTSPELASLSGLERIWLEPGITHRFDPLVDTAFWIEKKLWGTAPLGYHLISITCHVGAALLLVAVLRRLQIRGAWFAAAIFALHPVHVESVAWISELKNTLSGVVFLGTVLTYLRFAENRTPSSYAMAMGLFVAALLGKTTAVVWPIGMLVILWWKRGILSWRRDVLPLIPFVAVALLDGWVALGIERETVGNASGELRFSLAQRLVIAGHACWFYLRKLLWPVGLCPIYPRWQIDHLTGVDGLYPLGFLVLLAALWVQRNRSRAPLAALLFFVGALSPLLGIFSFSYQRYSFVADHFQYLASLGVITLVASGSVWLQDRWRLFPRSAGIGLCLALLATLATLTRQHSRAFTDSGTFARTTLKRNPDSWSARDQLGVVLASEGKPAEAIDQLHQALRANPKYVLAHYDLGCVLQSQGRREEAAQQFREALRRQPNLVRPRYNLGCILASQGKFADAIEEYQEALRREPNASEVRNNLGVALASSGKLDDAIAQFRQAIELRPDFAEAHVNLGHALANRNQFAEAIQQYDEALRFDPKNASDHYDLATALANSGNLVQATEQFREAARLNPDLPDVHGALAKVLEQQGLRDEAQRESAEGQRRATTALKESPDANSVSAP